MTDPVIGQAAASHIVGYLLNMILYGILILQTYLYYISFPRDSFGIKTLVYTLFLIETAQSIMMIHDSVIVFGLNYGDPMELRYVHLAWFSIPILSCTVSSIVQTFFAWRIYVLGDSVIIPLIILTIVLLQLGSGIAQGVFSYLVNDFANLPKITAGIWLVAAAVCDVIIAICMTWILSRKQGGFSHTNVLLTRIMKMTIETGAVTAVMAVITAALDLGMPTHNYFVPPSYILGKLYANNLVVILNSRIRIDGSRDQLTRGVTSSSSFTPQSPSFGLRARHPSSGRHNSGPISVSVTYEQERYTSDMTKEGPLTPSLRSMQPVMLSSPPTSKELKPFDDV